MQTHVSRPKPAALTARIRSYFHDQNLRPGATLPSERDLAEALGVGRAQIRTAYRHLEQEGAIRSISPRKRVLARAAGADSNALMTRTVVVMSTVSNPHIDLRKTGHQEILFVTGIAHAAHNVEINVLMQSPQQIGDRSLRGLVDARPLGVIGLGGMLRTPGGVVFLERLQQAGIPTAALGGDLDLAVVPIVSFDQVTSNHETGAAGLVHWLHDHGCRRIAFFNLPDSRHSWFHHRRQGYRSACRDLGLPRLEVDSPAKPVSGDLQSCFKESVASRRKALQEVLSGDDPADAIMLVTDGSHCATAAACRELGFEPGKDLLIAGYDNYWSVDENRAFESSVPAVTVDKRVDKVGAAFLEIISDRADGVLDADPKQIFVKPDLIETDNAPEGAG